MPSWSKNKVSSSNLNNGNQYENGNLVTPDSLNAANNNAFYAVDFVEALTQTPDTTNAGNVGTPSVSIIDDGNGKKKFKFENLKGETGDTGATGTTGATGAKGDIGLLLTVIPTVNSVLYNSRFTSYTLYFNRTPSQINDEKSTGVVKCNNKLYYVAFNVLASNTGTYTCVIYDSSEITGDSGEKGDKGDTGDAGTIAVGSVTTGTTTSVTNVGTSTNAIFNFVLQKGEKGDDGANTISVSSTGTSTDEVNYITINGVENKLAGGGSSLQKYSMTFTTPNSGGLSSSILKRINNICLNSLGNVRLCRDEDCYNITYSDPSKFSFSYGSATTMTSQYSYQYSFSCSSTQTAFSIIKGSGTTTPNISTYNIGVYTFTLYYVNDEEILS